MPPNEPENKKHVTHRWWFFILLVAILEVENGGQRRAQHDSPDFSIFSLFVRTRVKEASLASALTPGRLPSGRLSNMKHSNDLGATDDLDWTLTHH